MNTKTSAVLKIEENNIGTRDPPPLPLPWQNCTTPPFNRNFGIFLGWHVIIWDGSQVKAFPNPDQPPLAIFLTYQAFCTGMKILHLILLRFVKLESEISLLI